MDFEATKTLVNALKVANPAYREWLTMQAEAAARDNQTSTLKEVSSIVSSMQRALADVTWEEVEPVIVALERGDLSMPTFSEMARFVRAEALHRRGLKRKQDREARLQYAAEPRYRCLHCRDNGIAHAIDPNFAEAFRERFLAMPEEEFIEKRDERTWWLKAKDWYAQRTGKRKIEYGVACSCSAGDRLAERMQRLDPQRMPVLHGLQWARDTLQKWYADHPDGAVVFWEVPEWKEEMASNEQE